MKRKVVILVSLALVLIATQGFSWAIGAEARLDTQSGLSQPSWMVTGQFPKIPIMWGLGAQFNGNQWNLNVTGDWWLINQHLASMVNIYVGPGFFLAANPFEIGARLPIGLNIFPLNFLEIFLEPAPALLIYSSQSGVTIPDFRLQVALGIRFWFK